MADEADDESASSLRSRISEKDAKARQYAAKAAIAEHSLTHVKVDELLGKDSDEIEQYALSLNEQREQAAQEALKDMLKAKGVEDVDAAMEKLLNGEGGGPQVPQEAIDNARHLAGSGGPIRTEDISHLGLDGPAQMLHYFQQQSRKG